MFQLKPQIKPQHKPKPKAKLNSGFKEKLKPKLKPNKLDTQFEWERFKRLLFESRSKASGLGWKNIGIRYLQSAYFLNLFSFTYEQSTNFREFFSPRILKQRHPDTCLRAYKKNT